MQIIDKIDKHIIEKLITDGRCSFANIAKDINLTDVAIKKRLERLKQRGIIKNIFAEIDYNVIGYLEIIEMLISIDPSKKNEIIKKLVSNEEIINIYEVTGEYNIVCKIIAQDKNNLTDILDNVYNIDGVKRVNILTILKEHKSSKNLPNKILQTTF
jgi:DNA-binding Lrp family transcriptional regulator